LGLLRAAPPLRGDSLRSRLPQSIVRAPLVLWLTGFVAFWLFMLFKPVKGDQ